MPAACSKVNGSDGLWNLRLFMKSRLLDKRLGHLRANERLAMSEPLFEIDIQRPAKGSRDGSRLLYAQLRAAILNGRLPSGALLPPTRRSTAVFGVSRNTAIEVYEKLLNEGLVVARQGSGTRVVETRPTPARSTRTAKNEHDARLNPFWISAEARSSIGFWRSTTEDPCVRPGAPPTLEFRPALVDLRLFPQAAFRRLVAQQFRSLERTPPRYRSFEGNQGNHRLRTAITQYIAVTRGIASRPADVLITAGAQQAFDLLARTLVAHPGMIVAIEDPGYPPMRVAFAAAGARLVPVPVDEEGLIVERLPPEAKIICLCPSHQFPLGVSMSRDRRKALVAHARRLGAVIVEDDYDGEFRYDGGPLEALVSEDAADVVFYVGTFSKSMLPSLRLGFVIAPNWAMPTLIAAKNSLDWHCPTALQAGVAAFIDQGHLTRHVRKMRRVYGERRKRLFEALAGPLAPWLEPIPSSYGMHVAAVGRGTYDLDEIASTVLVDDMRLHTLRRYYLGAPVREGFIFGLGVADEAQIAAGIARLRQALER